MDYLENVFDSKLVQIHNEYCYSANYNDDLIYKNGEYFFTGYYSSVMDAIMAVSYGDYNYSHKWVQLDGCANLQSFDNVEDYIDMGAIADDYLDNPSNYHGIEL